MYKDYHNSNIGPAVPQQNPLALRHHYNVRSVHQSSTAPRTSSPHLRDTSAPAATLFCVIIPVELRALHSRFQTPILRCAVL